MRRSRSLVALIVVLGGVASGCGDDLPSKSDFVEKMRSEGRSEVVDGLEKMGIDKAKADKLLDDLYGCMYDKIAEDPDGLKAAFDNPATADKTVQTKAASCGTELQAALTEVMSSAGG